MAKYHGKLRKIPNGYNVIVDDLNTSAEVLPHEIGSRRKTPPVLYSKTSEDGM